MNAAVVNKLRAFPRLYDCPIDVNSLTPESRLRKRERRSFSQWRMWLFEA